MKKLLILALLVAATPAWAQNIQCPNRPLGDSTNACANTRFVQENASGGNPGGVSGQIQWNNAGAFGGFTASGDFTINTSTGVGTLSTVNANVGSFGSATQCTSFTTNAKGQITAASNTTCTPAVGSITGLGTGVATALGINIGSAGAPVLLNGAGGTPSSITLTNASGYPTATTTTSGVVTLGTQVREKLSANRTFYVRTDGNNTACTGLTNAAYVSGSFPQNCAFLTIQQGIDSSTLLDLSNFMITIQVGAGTYTTPIVAKSYVGLGPINIIGDTTTPSNVFLNITSANAFSLDAIKGLYQFNGFRIVTTTSAHHISMSGGSQLYFGNIEFGAAASGFNHINMVGAGTYAKANANYAISGGSSRHASVSALAFLDIAGRTLTLTGTPAWAAYFVDITAVGVLYAYSMTFSGAATGARFNVGQLGMIQTFGSTPASYFPGNAGGTGTNPSASPYGLYN